MDYIEKKSRTKKKLSKPKKNLDSIMHIHEEKIKYFNNLQKKVLPLKKEELKKNKTDGNALIEKEITDIEERVEENNYYLSTSKILERYFSQDILDKASIMREYYVAIGMNIPKELYEIKTKKNIYDCTECGGGDCIVRNSECYSCTSCGVTLNEIMLPETISYKESQNYDYTTVVEYKRINYFIEWLNQIQGREHTTIPGEILNKLNEEIKKEKIYDTSKISTAIIRRLLKKIGESKYYEHTPTIISRLTGVPPIDIPPIIEDKLKFMFNEIQEPWERFKDTSRSSFFSYPVVIHKFCQILELPEYLPFFPLLKSREKLYKQEVVFKKIVEYLAEKNKKEKYNKLYDINWRFIPSI